jgi:uncharacterized OB-fold protein
MSIEHRDYEEEPRFFYYRDEPDIIEVNPVRVMSHVRDAMTGRRHDESSEIEVGERLEAAFRRREQQPESPTSDA